MGSGLGAIGGGCLVGWVVTDKTTMTWGGGRGGKGWGNPFPRGKGVGVKS